VTSLAERVAERIRRSGPLPYSVVIDAALYDESSGFYAARGGAGRRADFMTSVEVGPLFAAVLARYLDHWWERLGRPDPFRVVECGAGAGTLARGIAAARPRCAPALRYEMVERSDRLRSAQPAEPPFVPRADLPAAPLAGVVLANELLDNLAFDLLERTASGWDEVRVGLDDEGRLVEQLTPLTADLAEFAPDDGPVGVRIPVQREAQAWLTWALASAVPGVVVVFDYATTIGSILDRRQTDWLRTYRGHGRGGAALDDLGEQDVTCDLVLEQLAAVRPPDRDRSQTEFLTSHGLDDLVSEGNRIWSERAHVGDLAALAARSRVREAEALSDPDGLGAHRVLEWETAAAAG
jgi:SAM-dependent MidA family methyltransferase